MEAAFSTPVIRFVWNVLALFPGCLPPSVRKEHFTIYCGYWCYGLGMRPVCTVVWESDQNISLHTIYLCNFHKVWEVALEVLSLQCWEQPLPPLQPVLIVCKLDTSCTSQWLKTLEEFRCLGVGGGEEGGVYEQIKRLKIQAYNNVYPSHSVQLFPPSFSLSLSKCHLQHTGQWVYKIG